MDLHRHEDPSSGTLAARAFTSNEICIEKQDASNQKVNVPVTFHIRHLQSPGTD